ncbi:MAG: ABC transporter ATP-binding protein [Gammaproteobacteria bacterium]|nr:ABC transporter ATP-binding protein [Gammaproteobacteria bacterium]
MQSPAIPALELRGISKQYPMVLANDRIDLQIFAGEIHAVLGENGAGKSTLMKIIYGIVHPDAGDILIAGKSIKIQSPWHARDLGISMVFQHFSLFDTLTVAENIWLGLDKSLDLSTIKTQTRKISNTYGLEIEVDRIIHTLSVGERQRVEILRALLSKPKIFILDEPTSVLTPQAVEKLFVVLRQLASEGCAIVYISHKLHEIRSLCQRCTVLRNGRVTGHCDPRQETNASLSVLMIGQEAHSLPERTQNLGEPVLEIQNLSVPTYELFGTHLENISLTLCQGEIVGLAGVSGNGQKELLQILSGENPNSNKGAVLLRGVDLRHRGPIERRNLGLYSIPEERIGRGAVPGLSLAENLLLTRHEALGTWGWIKKAKLKQQALEIINKFKVKAPSPEAQANALSGGNLQKFIVGRECEASPRVLIVAQPTWGVDVGAANIIHNALLSLRKQGCALLIVSEELDELMELSDRIYVLAAGKLSPSLNRKEADLMLIGEWMSGHWSHPAIGVAC